MEGPNPTQRALETLRMLLTHQREIQRALADRSSSVYGQGVADGIDLAIKNIDTIIWNDSKKAKEGE